MKQEHKVEHHDEHHKNDDYPDLLTGPFGTKDKPVVVKSVFNERIVGCLGKYSCCVGCLFCYLFHYCHS